MRLLFLFLSIWVFLQLTQFPCYNQTSTIVIASLLNTFFFLFFFVDIFLLFFSNECKNAHKPQRFLSCREHFLFLFTGISFSLYRLLFKSDGGEENLFIGCACFSHSLVRAKRKYCKRVKSDSGIFLFFVCMQNICTLDLRNSNNKIFVLS